MSEHWPAGSGDMNGGLVEAGAPAGYLLLCYQLYHSGSLAATAAMESLIRAAGGGGSLGCPFIWHVNIGSCAVGVLDVDTVAGGTRCDHYH